MPKSYLPTQKFGLWTPIGLIKLPNQGHAGWRVVCRCDCGTVRDIYRSSLTNGKSVSCGCHNRSMHHYIHGAARKNNVDSEYSIWLTMRARCTNPNNSGYERYGGCGISVCARWEDFRNFIADMGKRPSKNHSIDRINNSGNYEPSNCRWATKKEQANNRKPRRWRRRPTQ